MAFGNTVRQLTPAFAGGQAASVVLVDLSAATLVDPVAADQLLAAQHRLGREGKRVVVLCRAGDVRDAPEGAGLTDIIQALVDLDGAPFSSPPPG